MAQLLAPYNNSMRLGQGFNSYTHQICLHNAVTVPRSSYLGTPSTDDEWVHAEDEEYQPDPEDEPEEKAQIVTYSTRFVEKISEVVGEYPLAWPVIPIDDCRFHEYLRCFVYQHEHDRRICERTIHRQ